MPSTIFFACLDLEQESSFMDGHYFTNVAGSKSGFVGSTPHSFSTSATNLLRSPQSRCRNITWPT